MSPIHKYSVKSSLLMIFFHCDVHLIINSDCMYESMMMIKKPPASNHPEAATAPPCRIQFVIEDQARPMIKEVDTGNNFDQTSPLPPS